jgi:hypothetical protein
VLLYQNLMKLILNIGSSNWLKMKIVIKIW